jgi:hypothetical protein
LGIRLINGGNNQQPAPALTAALFNGTFLTITGTLTAAPNTTYTVEFFHGPDCNPSGFGEGRFELGTITVTTSSTGTAPISAVFFSYLPNEFITATATDPDNNTSDFSNCVPFSGPNVPQVVINPGAPYLGGQAVGVAGGERDASSSRPNPVGQFRGPEPILPALAAQSVVEATPRSLDSGLRSAQPSPNQADLFFQVFVQASDGIG